MSCPHTKKSSRRSSPPWSTPWAWTRRTSPARRRLQGDLGAESIDLLDIVFRLERNFGIKIPRGELFPENLVADPEWIENGKLTAKGLSELKGRMPFADLSEVRGRPARSRRWSTCTRSTCSSSTSRASSRPDHGRRSRRTTDRCWNPGWDRITAGRDPRSRFGPPAWTFPAARPPLFNPNPAASSTMRWIWIDKFLEFRSGQFARAIKNLTLAEEHLHDHFPGYPVMPASLIIEGLAQTGGHPGRRGGRVRREGGAGQDPPGRVLRRGLRRRSADLRGDADRPADRRGRGRGQGVPRRRTAGGRRDRLRSSGQHPLEPDLRAQELRVHPAVARRARPGQGPGAGPRARPLHRTASRTVSRSTRRPRPDVASIRAAALVECRESPDSYGIGRV